MRAHYTLDTIVTGILAMNTVISTLLLDALDRYSISQAEELRLLLIPFLGSMVASGGMIMLNPNPETRRIVIGRAVFALICGATFPQILTLIFVGLQPLFAHPVILLMSGAGFSAIIYVISRPFTARLYASQEQLANAAMDRVREQFRIDVKSVVKEVKESENNSQ
jgi:hypothetical protein